MLGVDVLRDQPIREYRLDVGAGERQPTAQAFLGCSSTRHRSIITEVFARRHGLVAEAATARCRRRSTLRLAMGDRVRAFRVRGAAAQRGPARALDGNFVLMDIAAAQRAFDRLGRVDRVDVRLAEPVAPRRGGARDRRAAAGRARRAAPGTTRAAGRADARGVSVQPGRACPTSRCWSGLFLVYNTVATSVIARRDEIGMLRALGTPRRRCWRCFSARPRRWRRWGASSGIPLGWGAGARRGGVHLVDRHDPVRGARGRRAGARPGPMRRWRSAWRCRWRCWPRPRRPWRPPRVSPSARRPWRRRRQRASRRCDGVGPLGGRRVPAGCGARAARPGRSAGCPSSASLSAVADRLRARGAGAGGPAGLASLTAGDRSAGWASRGASRTQTSPARFAGSSVSVAALAVSLAMLVAIAVMIGSFRETVIYWVAPDAARRPLRRHRAALEPRRAGHHLAGARAGHRRRSRRRRRRSLPGAERAVPRPPHRARARATFACCSTTARWCSSRRPMDRRRWRRRSGATRWWCPRACRCGSASASATASTCRRQRGRARSWSPRSTTTTRPTAACVVMDRATFLRHFGDQRPTSLSVYLRPGADAAGRPRAPDGAAGAVAPPVHPHQHDAAGRGAAHLRRHLRDHLRPGSHRHRRGGAWA